MMSKKAETWIQYYWRPAMAWQYFVVCLFDFFFAPIMTALFFKWTAATYVPWEPLTLSNGGLYHLAMGAIIGVAAWSRSREKIQKMLLDGGVEETEIEITKQTVNKN